MKYNEKGNLVLETEREFKDIALDSDYILISDHPTKHDMSLRTIVFLYEGKHWMVSYERSYNYGLQWYDETECTEVEQREVVVKKWMPKYVL